MKKIANQILYNLKKEKSSFISFGVIILITALILNCAAVLLCQVDRAYDTKFEKLSTAMLNAIVPEVQNSSELEKAIDEIENRFRYNDAVLRYLITRVKKAFTEPSPIMKSMEAHRNARDNREERVENKAAVAADAE